MNGHAVATILGIVSAPVERRTTKRGGVYSQLLVEIQSRRKGIDGKWEEIFNLIPVTLFGRTVEIAERFLSPGDAVFLQCRVAASEFLNKEGAKRHAASLLCEAIHLLPNGRARQPGAPREHSDPKPPTADDHLL
jgi:single-stranded DNA-binding protein